MADNIEEPGMGHNSLSAKELERILAKVEALIEERRGINNDIKLVMDDAKGKGYDTRTLKEVLKVRALDPDTRAERDQLRDMYLSALGLI